MVSSFIYALIAVPVILVVAFLVTRLRTLGQWLKCPDCGEVFKAPATDQKSVGFGPVPAGIGILPCPKCGQTRRRADYAKVPAPQAAQDAQAS